MRVYAEVLPPGLGRAMHRINAALRACAPPGVTFVDDVSDADVQVLDVIGLGSLRFLEHESYVLLQHCYLTAETQDPEYWLPFFRRARLVVSYHDLRAHTDSDEFPFLRVPWGVDGDVFRDLGLVRDLGMLTTGYEASGEAILECHEASRRAGRVAAHLGCVAGIGDGVERFDAITDEELAALYSRTRFVSGLRRGEGFELPVVEGLACGARPICFDTPGYRHWFDDHALFVPEVPAAELTENLTNVLGGAVQPVTAEERAALLARFGWPTIGEQVWTAIQAAASAAQ